MRIPLRGVPLAVCELADDKHEPSTSFVYQHIQLNHASPGNCSLSAPHAACTVHLQQTGPAQHGLRTSLLLAAAMKSMIDLQIPASLGYALQVSHPWQLNMGTSASLPD